MDLNESNIPNSLVNDSGTQRETILPADTSSFAEKLNAPDPLAGTDDEGVNRSGPLVIMGVVALAVGSLFFMKFLATASAGNGLDNEDASTVDAFIESLTGGSEDNPFGSLEQGTLEVLQETYADHQIPLSQVRGDAFVFQGKARPSSGSGPELIPAKGANPNQAWLEQVRSAAGYCELKSVMGGSNPLANISGHILQLGDIFNSSNSDISFMVKIIDSDSVLLEARSDKLALTTQVRISIDMHR